VTTPGPSNGTPTGSLVAAFSGAVAISFSAIFFALAEVTPLTGAFFRMLYAAPFLGLLWWSRRHLDRRTRRERAIAFVAGVLLALDIVAWHTSIEMIGTGLATLIANSQVGIVPLVTWMLLGERPARAALIAMPVVMVGLSLITGLGREDTFGDRPVMGVAVAVFAAILYSGFLIGYRRSNRSLAPPAGSLMDAVLGGILGLGLAGTLFGSLDPVPSWPAHGWLLALALASQVLGWLAIGYALPRLPAAHTSFAILLQPTLTIVWGRILFDERASMLQLTGVILVLAGIIAVTVGSRTRKPSLPSAA